MLLQKQKMKQRMMWVMLTEYLPTPSACSHFSSSFFGPFGLLLSFLVVYAMHRHCRRCCRMPTNASLCLSCLQLILYSPLQCRSHQRIHDFMNMNCVQSIMTALCAVMIALLCHNTTNLNCYLLFVSFCCECKFVYWSATELRCLAASV